MAYAFDTKTLYEATDKGLEILKYFLNHCKDFDKALQNQKNPFQFRDNDDTLSAYLVSPDKKLKGDAQYWRFKDYGDDFYTPIKLAMEKTGLDFYPCLKYLYEQFGLTKGKSFFQAETEVKTLDDSDQRKPGWCHFENNATHHDLKVIGRFVTPELAAEYHFVSIDYYEKVFIKKGTTNKTYIKVKATPSFPIFAYAPDGKKWCKTYAPLSNDKQYKHGYLGEKPERYIHGLDRLKKAYDKQMADFTKAIKQAQKDKDEWLENKLINEKSDFKFNRAIICSGGSDGLNVASLGEFAIWFNSESEQLTYPEYLELLKYVKQVYNLADVDEQGTKYAYEVAEKFFDLKTIWLPKEKLGVSGKDFRDWMKFYNSAEFEAVQRQFYNLVNGALKMRFYEKPDRKPVKIKPTYLHYFLKVKGFYLYYPEKQFTEKISEQEYIFIRVVDNVVSQVFPNDIRKFCERYLIAKGESISVIDCIKTSVQFNDKNLLGIDNIVLNFKNYTMDSQTFFFKNVFATVTADGIELKAYKHYKNNVWDDSILSHNILPEKPFFKHTIDDNGIDRVEILRTDCDFMNYLINGSRTYWRLELEQPFAPGQEAEKKEYHNKNRFNLFGDNLTDAQKQAQAQHFLNKCYGIGYLMHRQKRESFAKALYITDDLEKDSEHDANGGSGKSLMLNGVDKLLRKKFKIDGKNKNITTDKHILHGLTKKSDYIYIEDLDQFISIDFFYNWITSSVVVNPKNLAPYEIDFFDFGKVVINSNFGLSKAVASTLRRLFFISFSDYYHAKNDNYLEERKVCDDFGYDLFSSAWDDKQWNIFYNFLLFCNQFYLQNFNREIEAPRENIDINNAKASMGDVFLEWCESYFCETQTILVDKEIVTSNGTTVIQESETIPGTLNEYVPRAAMQKSYADRAGKWTKTSANFKASLKQWCKYKGYILNPKDLCDKDGYIKKPIVDANGKRQNVEHFFIRTNSAIATQENAAQDQAENVAEKSNDKNDLPF